MELFACGCCATKYPTLHRHMHHKQPRSIGGKDTPDNLIDLCPGCHDALHSFAYRMLSKKAPHAQIIDALHILFPENARARTVCLDLASQVRNALIVKQEKDLGPNHIINIGTSIRKYFKPMLMSRYRELNISQEQYLRSLIISDLSRRYNLSANAGDEAKIIKQIKKDKSNPNI